MSSQPFIQVVDENNKPLRSEAIETVYNNSLIHRVVLIGIKNKKGEILLQKRGKDLVTYPGRWDISSAGHVDAGESYIDAAKRELKEELGITGVELKELKLFYNRNELVGRIQRRFITIYEVVLPNETPIKIDNQEVIATKWCSLDEVRSLIELQPDKVASGLIVFMDQIYS
ncbi:MAG: NUDIX domain-containing protein [Candidatus Saccharimonadales bacterium]